MQRAFHQLNWKEENGLLRHVVVGAWKSVTDAKTPSFTRERLVVIARSEDRNRDGIIDLLEFLRISEKIVNEIERIHDQDMQNTIQQAMYAAIGNNEKKLEESRRANLSEALLPWGWVFVAPQSFIDTISLYEASSLPHVHHYSLTCMAYFSASRSLGRISKIEGDYSLLCSADGVLADPAIIEALTTMKNAALKFTILENQDETETWFSDIEKLEVECRILHAVDSKNSAIEGFSAEAVRIRSITSAYRILMDHILAFLQTMDDAYKEHKKFSADRSLDTVGIARDVYKTEWSSKRMEARARLVSIQLATWPEVENDMRLCREWSSERPQIAELALQIAKSENAVAKRHLCEKIDIREKIDKVLFPKEFVVNMRVASASGLPKSKWSKLGRLPSPFAVVTEKISKRDFDTNIVSKSTTPQWDEPFSPVSLGIGYNKGIVVRVYDSSSDRQKKIDQKYSLGSTAIYSDEFRSQKHAGAYYDKPTELPDLQIEGKSLYRAFSGNLHCSVYKMKTNADLHKAPCQFSFLV